MFNVALRSLNTLGEQRALWAGVVRLHRAIWASKAQMQSLHCQISSHPAELESIQSEIDRLEASLKAINRQSPVSQAAFTSSMTAHDESKA